MMVDLFPQARSHRGCFPVVFYNRVRQVACAEIPEVPADRLSKIPLYDRSAKKRARAR